MTATPSSRPPAAGGPGETRRRLVLAGDGPSAVIARELPEDLSGQLPVLRRLSTPGEPPVFGVVWDADELAALAALGLDLGPRLRARRCLSPGGPARPPRQSAAPFPLA